MSINRNNFRWFLVALILILCVYAVLAGPKTELLYEEAIADLARWQKTELFLSYAPVEEIQGDLILVQQFADLVPVMVNAQNNLIKAGDFISFRGFLNNNLEIVANDYHIHSSRNEKYWLSLLPLAVVGFYLIRNFKR